MSAECMARQHFVVVMQEKCCRLQAGTEPPATPDRLTAATGVEKPRICYFSDLGRVREHRGGDDLPCCAGEQAVWGALSASGAQRLAEKSPVTYLRAIPALSRAQLQLAIIIRPPSQSLACGLLAPSFFSDSQSSCSPL